MVEYALLVAHNAVGSLAGGAAAWVSHLDTKSLGYVVLVLVAVRLVTWAFRPVR